MFFAERLVQRLFPPENNDWPLPDPRYLFSSYGIEWPLLVFTRLRSAFLIRPSGMRSSRKLALVTGWFSCPWTSSLSGLSTTRLASASETKIYLFDRPGSAQSAIYVGVPAANTAFGVANRVLGED